MKQLLYVKNSCNDCNYEWESQILEEYCPECNSNNIKQSSMTSGF